MTEKSLLQLDGVSACLSGRLIVTNLSLNLERGSVLGLLGVNGAGKTTTLRMIAGVLNPTRGSVFIDGSSLHKNSTIARRKIGYLPEQAPLYDELTVKEYLTFCARLRGLHGRGIAEGLTDAIDRSDLGAVQNRLIGLLSKGFRQRVGIAQAVLHSPDLIILDEPTSGLDPVQSAKIRDLIKLLGEDHGVVLSSHLLADVQACCDRVAVLHAGHLRYLGGMAQLATDGAVRVRLAAFAQPNWNALTLVRTAAMLPDGSWRLTLNPPALAAELAQGIIANGWGLSELRAEGASLEEIFMRIATDESYQQGEAA